MSVVGFSYKCYFYGCYYWCEEEEEGRHVNFLGPGSACTSSPPVPRAASSPEKPYMLGLFGGVFSVARKSAKGGQSWVRGLGQDLLTCLLTCLLACLLAYLHIDLLACILAYSATTTPAIIITSNRCQGAGFGLRI